MADTITNLTKEMNDAMESRDREKFVIQAGRTAGNERDAIALNYIEAYRGGKAEAARNDFLNSPQVQKGTADPNIAHKLSPYTFKMNRECKNYKEMLFAMYSIGKTEKELTPKFAKEGQLSPSELIPFFTGEAVEDGQQSDAIVDTNWTRFSVDDTSIGGNSAINSRWGFNRDDDIIAPLQAEQGNPNLGGLGRVYFENYQVHQQLLSITLGVPEFQSLWKFYAECVDGDLANDVNSGESSTISKMFGSVLGGACRLVIKIALFPARFPGWMADMLDPSERVTRYYELRSAMPMYYKFVNSLFAQVATLMGMTQNAFWMPDSWFPKAGTGGQVMSGVNGEAYTTMLQRSLNPESELGQVAYQKSMPPWLGPHGPNIYDILAKRDKKLGLVNSDPERLEKYMAMTDPAQKEGGGLFDAWSNRGLATMTGADKFVSFRINKNTDSSETISNQTGQSTVAQWLNNAANQGRDARFSAGGSFSKLTSIPGLGGVIQSVADFASGLLQKIKFVDVATTIMTGSGFIDIPEIWTGSSFAKSYSFNMTFRPGAGDNGTILGDEYLPLCMLLAMACPRSVGINAFSSPFLMRAYCKGMFAVPLGIIESMTITRGSSEFGWNLARLPTVISVSMSIKDLAPVMHLAMADTASGFKVFGANTSMQEYMHTLAGSGLNERILFSSSVARRMALSAQLIRSTYLNPNFQATVIGNMAFPRIAGAFMSTSLLE